MKQIINTQLPQITLIFWIIKILATTLGETFGDLLSMTLSIGYIGSACILILIFLIVLWFQLKSKFYKPYLYWLTILLTSTVGTNISDFMDRTLGLGYMAGSSILSSMLILILIYWKITGKPMDMINIKSKTCEIYSCMTRPIYNIIGEKKGRFCAEHKEPNMVDIYI
jgi:uncharacterized membrane-anchored protein